MWLPAGNPPLGSMSLTQYRATGITFCLLYMSKLAVTGARPEAQQGENWIHTARTQYELTNTFPKERTV